MPDQIIPSDLSLFQKAQKAMEQAQLLAQFASGHITETYKLTPQDKVDLATGIITRHVEPEAPAAPDQPVQ